MKTHTLYTREDCGCFADGSYGYRHCSETAIALALSAGWEPNSETQESIDGADDYEGYDEAADEAVEYLNEHCVEPGLSFIFDNGDLLLVEDEAEAGYFDRSGR